MTHDPRPTFYGLIGYPLSHSFSPAYFREKFAREGINARYEAFPLGNIDGLKDLLDAHPGLCGLNVTTPHKQTVMPVLHEIDVAAKEIGAVNCIRIQDGRLQGFNTDWPGFRDSLRPFIQDWSGAALVLGTGGGSLAVHYALKQMGILFKTVSRTAGKGDLVYGEVTSEILARHTLIINTTTLGTHGQGLPPLPYEALTAKHLLYDLVYNPPLTPFLAEGKAHGAAIFNGQKMLELQAEASWKIWQMEE